jgi:hypothetical protein
VKIAECRLKIGGLVIGNWRLDWRLAIAADDWMPSENGPILIAIANRQSAVQSPMPQSALFNRQSPNHQSAAANRQ